MKKTLSILLALLVVLAAFSGCKSDDQGNASTPSAESGSTQSAAEEPKLEGKIVFATHMTDKADTVIADLAQEFMDAHPGTEIEIEAVKDAAQSLGPRITAGEAPDIYFGLNGFKKSDFERYFLPIDDLGFNPDNCYVQTGNDGKVYGLVSSVAYNGVTYNKKVFEELDLEIPTTLEEFYDVCEAIKQSGRVPVGSNFKDQWPLQYFCIAYYPQVTGWSDYYHRLLETGLFPKDGATTEGLKIMRELNERGYLDEDLTSTNWDQFQKDMATGDTVMCYMGTWIAPQIVDKGANEEDIGVFPFPGVKYQDVGCDYRYGVSKDTQNPDLAKAFLKFLWTDGKFTEAIEGITPIIGAEVDDPFVDELLSYDLPTVMLEDPSEEYLSVSNEMQLNWGAIIQEYILADDPDGVIAKYNQQFEEAKAEVGVE